VRKAIIIFSFIVYILLKVNTTFTLYESLSIVAFVFFLLDFLDSLGKRLVIRDLQILTAIFTCLLLPILGYHHFDSNNLLARRWVVFMRVPSDDYYSFMLPATIALIVGLKTPLFFKTKIFKNQVLYMRRAEEYVKPLKWQGLILVAIGLLGSFIQGFVPAALSHVMYLMSYLMFVGVFYCLYSDMPRKRTVLILVFALLFYRSISQGMFGELVFMGTMTLILVLLAKKINFVTKAGVFAIGVFFILTLQAVKPIYRSKIWFGYKGDKLELFVNLFAERLVEPLSLFDNEGMLFHLYSRFNQGFTISRVIQSVPARKPYANGETIFLSLAGSFIPRFIWPDKPKAGGAYNFQRFLGVTLKGYSIGLSPFGESWGNFGKVGGIVFMFFFGLLFNFFFHLLLKIAIKIPSLILWCPYLFFYSVTIETDVFTMVNSFTQAAIFCFLTYKLFQVVIKMKI
jgi:hypothetical protein